MVVVQIEIKTTVNVKLPINSYDDISDSNMTLKESDNMIQEALGEQFGIDADTIRVIKEITFVN